MLIKTNLLNQSIKATIDSYKQQEKYSQLSKEQIAAIVTDTVKKVYKFATEHHKLPSLQLITLKEIKEVLTTEYSSMKGPSDLYRYKDALPELVEALVKNANLPYPQEKEPLLQELMKDALVKSVNEICGYLEKEIKREQAHKSFLKKVVEERQNQQTTSPHSPHETEQKKPQSFQDRVGRIPSHKRNLERNPTSKPETHLEKLEKEIPRSTSQQPVAKRAKPNEHSPSNARHQ